MLNIFFKTSFSYVVMLCCYYMNIFKITMLLKSKTNLSKFDFPIIYFLKFHLYGAYYCLI